MWQRLVHGLGMAALLLGLSACGGGGSSPSSSTSTVGAQAAAADATHGTLLLDLTGGAARDVDHVWVTVSSVALHAQASQAWSSSDSSWTVVHLATPVVVDLAAVSTSTHSDMTRVLNGVVLPVGTYAQIRFFLLAQDATLDSAARGSGLQYNAQVDYTDASHVARTVPLELPQTEMGWRVTGSFKVLPYVSSHIVAQADISSGLVRFASIDGIDHFTFRSKLRSYDIANSGAIFGFLDPAYICGATGAPAVPNCAQDIIVSVQSLSSDGLRHESVRRYKVSTSGGFALYPLPPDTSFDLVITGRHMRPLLIKSVTVTPSDGLALVGWTTVGSYSATIPLQPLITPGAARTVNLATAVTPASSSLYWGQTVDGTGRPYELANVAADPFTGLLAKDVDLPEGNLRVATFVDSNIALTLSDVIPDEGLNALSLVALGTAYDTAGTSSVVTPALNVASTVTAHNPTRSASLGTAVIQLNLAGSLSASYDAAQIIVSDIHGIVATQAVSGSTASFTVPAGMQAAALGGTAIYTVAVRASSHTGAVAWVRATDVVDMRSSAGATLSLALP